MKKTSTNVLIASAIVMAFSGVVHAKKSSKPKPSAPTVTITSAPKLPVTAHTGVFNVEAGGVIYTCHNYCAGNTLTPVKSLY